MTVDYDSSKNLHTIEGPHAALKWIFPGAKPKSILDVGCGIGTWLRASLDLGIAEAIGVDGSAIKEGHFLVPRTYLKQRDLTQLLDMGRRFDAVLCLEVAEHLEKHFGPTLLDSLVRHADVIVFSAACPGQPGQHHVNCQWPSYWQKLFNERGYVCSDDVRWRMWTDDSIEPWYRQNMMIASRDPYSAGKEETIASVIHPSMMSFFNGFQAEKTRIETIRAANSGDFGLKWCRETLQNAFCSRTRRLWKKLVT